MRTPASGAPSGTERQVQAFARPFRVSSLLRALDYAFGLVTSSLVFLALTWTIQVTGPMTPDERHAVGAGYVSALQAIEQSARQLRTSFCEDRARSCPGSAAVGREALAR